MATGKIKSLNDKCEFISEDSYVTVATLRSSTWATYTIPETGWYIFETDSTTSGDSLRIKIGGRAYNLTNAIKLTFPLKKGYELGYIASGIDITVRRLAHSS